MVRIGACVVRVAVFSAVVYTAVQTNVARHAFRDYTIMPQYVTLFDIICPRLICVIPRLYVSKKVRNLLCDKFVVFSARQFCIMKLEIPRCDEGPWR